MARGHRIIHAAGLHRESIASGGSAPGPRGRGYGMTAGSASTTAPSSRKVARYALTALRMIATR